MQKKLPTLKPIEPLTAEMSRFYEDQTRVAQMIHQSHMSPEDKVKEDLLKDLFKEYEKGNLSEEQVSDNMFSKFSASNGNLKSALKNLWDILDVDLERNMDTSSFYISGFREFDVNFPVTRYDRILGETTGKLVLKFPVRGQTTEEYREYEVVIPRKVITVGDIISAFIKYSKIFSDQDIFFEGFAQNSDGSYTMAYGT